MTMYYFLVIAIIFCFGVSIGSFFNVLIYRLPKEEDVVVESSHCMSCNTKLKFYDLIPILSYIFLGGKCRYCKTKLSKQYPIVEFITGLIFAITTIIYLEIYNYQTNIEFALNLINTITILALSVPIFVIDLRHYIIPNCLVIFGYISALIIKVAASILLNNWWILFDALIGFAVGMGIFLLIALIGQAIMKVEVMGMGDVKLIAAVGLFLGWKLLLVAIFLSYISGSIISIILLSTKKKTRKDVIPFGPFIIIGTTLSIMFGNPLITWYISGFNAY